MNSTGTREISAFLASYAGIDGGNPGAPVWICGIEHGGAFDDAQLLPELKPGAWTDEFKSKHNFRAWQYPQKAAKFLVALRSRQADPTAVPTVEGWYDYRETELYVEGGDHFKLNLFPLAAPSVSSPGWETAYARCPELKNRETYRTNCRAVRFEFLRGIRNKYRPRIVVGTGKTLKNDFALAFGFSEVPPRAFTITDGIHDRECFAYEGDGCTLIVSPFFGGRYGVSSDGLLTDLAKHVADELAKRLIV